MAYALINSLPVIETRLQLPRFGNWTADVVVDAATAAQVPEESSVKLELSDGALAFVGTVFRADAFAQMVTLRMVGGRNGLAKECQPRFFNGVPLSTPLKAALADAGETLSSSSDAGSLNTQFQWWAMLKQPVSSALSSLTLAAPEGCVWRMQQDGTVFFGVDTFGTSQLSDYELIEYRPQEGLQVIAAEVPAVYPGQSFASRNVSDVEHFISARGMRTRVWFE